MSNITLQSTFDSIKHTDDKGNEFWLGRVLQPLLGYVKWQSFELIILKVIESFKVLGQNASDWITLTSKSIKSGKGRESQVNEYKLTKQACYLIAMNCDNSKTEVALAQQYFAAMTIFAEQVINNYRNKDSETDYFSQANYELSKQIGETARVIATENRELRVRIQELEASLGKYARPALPPSGGLSMKQILAYYGLIFDSTDGALFSLLATDINKACKIGRLPMEVVCGYSGKRRYQPRKELESYIRTWFATR